MKLKLSSQRFHQCDQGVNIIGVFMTCDCLKVSFDIKGIFKVYRRNSQIQTPLSDIQPNPEKKEKNNPAYRSLLAKRSKGKDRRW